MMEGNNKDKPPMKQMAEPEVKRRRRQKRHRGKRSGEENNEVGSSKKPKVDFQEEVSGGKQKNGDNKRDELQKEVKREEDIETKMNVPSKGLKVDPQVQKVPKVQKEASVGCGHNINNRHINQLGSLAALMSAKRRTLEITDDRDKALKVRGCSSGLYMEWSKNDDQYFLWGSIAEGKLYIKFEFHCGFELHANVLDVKNPMLAFSESFDCDEWREVKQMLQEIFGRADGEVPAGPHDYLLAFTRRKVKKRIFERFFIDFFDPSEGRLHTQPVPDMKSMRLEEISPSFILKPLEIHRPGDDSTENVVIEKFMDEDALMPEIRSGLKLVPSTMFYDDSSYKSMVPHTMLPAISHKVMLPLPAKDLQWLGFNSSGEEFFERYHAYRTTHVPGTGPDPTSQATDPTASAANSVYYDHITVPMKVFSRGLIICVKENHKYGCLSDFDWKNIFLRRGRVVILGVKLLPYSTEQAIKNFLTAHTIIMRAIQGMMIPRDLEEALDLLSTDPVGSYDIIVSNFAWMIASRRDNMVAELHENFSELNPDDQVILTQQLPEMDRWLEKFASNRLLYAVQTEMLPAKKVTNLEALQNYFEIKASKAQLKAAKEKNLIDLLIKDANLGLELFTGRRYFKGIRNSYVHVSNTSVKRKMGPLPIETVDLIVSSEFSAACSFVQKRVPKAFEGIDEHRASYKRFKTFFCGVEDIEFTAADEKLIMGGALGEKV